MEVKVIKDIGFTKLETENECEEFYLDLYLPAEFQNCDSLDLNTSTNLRNRAELNSTSDNTVKLESTNAYKDVACTDEFCCGVNHEYQRPVPVQQTHHIPVKVAVESERDLVRSDTVACTCRKSHLGSKTPCTQTSKSTLGGLPFVVFIHGGGWRRGAREAWKHYLYYDVNFLVCLMQFMVQTYSNVGETLAENGIPCAVISYPLTEASVGVALFEMFLSYLQCCALMFCCSIPFTLTALLFRSLFSLTYGSSSWEHLFSDNKDVGVTKLFVLSVMLVTNVCTIAVIVKKRQHFKLSKRHCVVFLVLLLVATVLGTYVSNSIQMLLFIMNIVTLVITQTSILRVRLSRQRRTYQDQLKVIRYAISWAKGFCKRTGNGTSSLYLMGHSAGGHLATLTALLEDDSKIKGVISISGVYDLLCLTGRLLKPVYLIPTFGQERDKWLAASPTHVIKTLESVQTKFLLLSAEKDPFLKQQSLEFYDLLRSKGSTCQHIEISKTNHFSIITGTNTDLTSPLGLAVDFIKR